MWLNHNFYIKKTKNFFLNLSLFQQGSQAAHVNEQFIHQPHRNEDDMKTECGGGGDDLSSKGSTTATEKLSPRGNESY
jgi:hypothetical protein